MVTCKETVNVLKENGYFLVFFKRFTTSLSGSISVTCKETHH